MQEKLSKLLQALQDYHPQRVILFGRWREIRNC